MIYILIPSYNDSENFDELLKNIGQALNGKRYKVIIVDDGSTDETKNAIKKHAKTHPVMRIGYAKNKGPGYAFKFGFNYLIPKIKDGDIVITLEADNTADFSLIPKMISKTKKYDVVLSSPYAKGGAFLGISLTRRILSLISNFLDKEIFRLKNVNTYSSFYRVYTAEILKRANKVYKDNLITEYGFSSVIEILIKLSTIGSRFWEIPAVVDWRNRQGKSKMKIAKTIIRHVNLYKNYFEGKYSQ